MCLVSSFGKIGCVIIIIMIIIIIVNIIIIITFFSTRQHKARRLRNNLVKMGVAVVIHSLGNVPEKVTTFPARPRTDIETGKWSLLSLQ